MYPVHCLLALVLTSTVAVTQAAGRLYACGDDQVREYQVNADEVTETWRWSAAQAMDLPVAYRSKLLTHIDECKPVDDGRAVLLTSSTGGVVLLDRASGSVLFRAHAPMAHSAELLPEGLIAVALSIDPAGDRLQLYNRQRNETPLFEEPLPSGHGVVWDSKRKRLLALSHDLLQSFVVTGELTSPGLKEVERWSLPGQRDGHDLSALGDGRYCVSTHDGVWLFNPQSGNFLPFEPLGATPDIKSVSVLGQSMAWVKVEENWWAYGFHLERKRGETVTRIPVKDLHLYKVRWIR